MATAAVYDINRSRSMFADEPAPKRRPAKDLDIDWCIQEIADSETEKNVHMQTWRDVMNLTMPNRQGFDGQAPGQARIPQEGFDSYPEDAMNRGVGNTVDAMSPPGQTWEKMVPGNDVNPKRRDAVARGTDKITKLIFRYLGKSLYQTCAHSMTYDLMVSTGFMSIDVGTWDNPFKVKVGSLDECHPVLGHTGEIQDVYRKYECRPQHIVDNWPGARLSPRIRKLLDAKSRDKVTIVEATVFEKGRGYRFAVFDPSDKSILYDVPGGDPLEPSRWITPRFGVRPKDTYGFGPGVTALRTMRTLNKTQELGLKARAKILAPPTIFDRRAGINPHTVRMGANYVGVYDGAALNGANPFAELPAGGNNAWSVEDIRDYRQIIDSILFAQDVIPPAEDFKGRTMYETQVRKQMVLSQRGVNLARLQLEWPDAVFLRCFWILGQLGMVPKVPVDGGILDMEPLGPIAQAQRAERAASRMAFVSNARAAFGDQVVALGVKVEDMVVAIGRDWPGVEAEDLRDEDEREQLQLQAAQIAQAQAAGAAPSMDPSALPGLA